MRRLGGTTYMVFANNLWTKPIIPLWIVWASATGIPDLELQHEAVSDCLVLTWLKGQIWNYSCPTSNAQLAHPTGALSRGHGTKRPRTTRRSCAS